MACERDRILDIINYMESLGLEVNIGKNKARGNKGFFKSDGNSFRVDIAKGQTEESVLKTLSHEFAHFVHYSYDKTLESLDFIFDNSEKITEELLAITVEMIPKTSIEPLFERKESLKSEIADFMEKLKFSDFELLEKRIKESSLKYLLKYDRVKVFEEFSFRIYKVEHLDRNIPEELYILLKSKQRALKRINSKISRLNKYYNAATELFARSLEMYISNPYLLKEIAPTVFSIYEDKSAISNIPELYNFFKIFFK